MAALRVGPRASIFGLLLGAMASAAAAALAATGPPAPVAPADPPVLPTTAEPLAAAARAADPALAAHVDGLVASLQREHALAGLALAVVRDGELVLARGYGWSDVAGAHAVDPDRTLFRIGSVSKTFIWTALMMLAERGRLDLDADVNRYLRTVRVVEAYGVPVTLRQLMHHRAGFEDSLRVFGVTDDDPRPLAALLAEHQPARVYPPGARTSYSNWGSALAAQVVADVTGEDFGAFLQREILDPLGMRDTVLLAPSRMDPVTRQRLATGYDARQGALAAQAELQLGAYWPAGGIAATATDMARWMRFHLAGGALDGVRLLDADTHARMWTRAYPDRPAAADLAHGFQDRPYRGLRVLGHGGATAAFYTNMLLVPELGLGVFVAQNGTQTRWPVTKLPELVIDRVRGTAYLPWLAADAPASAALAGLAGTYVQNRRVHSGFAAVFALTSVAQVRPLADDTLLVLLDGEAAQYRRVPDQTDTFEAVDGARIAFLRDAGRVVALADGSGVHTYEKTGPPGNPNTLVAALAAALLLSCTTLLGFWWRLGRGRAHGHGARAELAASASLGAAIATLGFVASALYLAVDFGAVDAAAFAGAYPRASMHAVHWAGWILAAATAVLWLALWPAWRAGGWGPWRRLHLTAYALALAATAVLLWRWRIYGAPVY